MRLVLIVALVCAIAAAVAKGLLDEEPDRLPPRPERAPAPGPEEIPRDPVMEGLRALVRDLVLGREGKDTAARMERRVQRILQLAHLGEEEERGPYARLTVRTMLRQIEEEVPRRGPMRGTLTPLQERAIEAMADRYAGDVYRRFPGSELGRRHEGALRRATEAVQPPEGHPLVSWTVLGGFEHEEGRPLPPEVVALDERARAVTGYMIPADDPDARHFLLVESLWSCCFGVPPLVTQVVSVTLGPEQEAPGFVTAPLLVWGRLEVGPRRDDEAYLLDLYRLKDARCRVLAD